MIEIHLVTIIERHVVDVSIIRILLQKNHDIYALEIENGKYYDCGNKLDYLKTVVEFGLKHPDTKDGFADFIRTLKA